MRDDRGGIPKRNLILGVMLMLGLAFFLWLPSRFLNPLRQLFLVISTPLENVFAWVAFEVRDEGQFLSSIGTLKSENERLHQELLTLQGNKALLSALQEENDALRQSISLAPHPKRTQVMGEIIARGKDGMTTSLRINRGKQDGIAEAMPVITADNILIGRIQAVTAFASEVRLLSHRESLIAVTVPGVTSQMIVRGDHGVGLVLDLARSADTLTPGAQVMTAGLSDGLPAGLLIGTIESAHLSPDQLFQQAVILPPVRTNELRFVSVITAF